MQYDKSDEQPKIGISLVKEGEKLVSGEPFKHHDKPKDHLRKGTPIKRGILRIIPLGGLDEVGKNMMVFEFGEDIVIVDMGFQFPDEDLLGVDYVIPDVSYLDDKIHRIRAVLLTHGHLDHIGAIPYLMPRLHFPPIYGTKLTLGLVKKKLEEFGLMKQARLHTFQPNDVFRFGAFQASFFRVNHSIPDAVGIVLKTPVGTVVHTGDFKFDLTPAGEQAVADFSKIASLGNQNVLALFSDSTNSLKPGHTISEKEIGRNLEEIIKNTDGRIIIAAFSSLIGRIQQIMNYAQKYNRKIFLSGRSLLDNFEIAKNLGYLKYPRELVSEVSRAGKIPDQNVLILTTGSQGEDVSALTRISFQDHPHVRIKKGDTVIISSTPIIGNERSVANVINNLCRLGARVIHSKIMDVHTSGHANQEDLKLMMSLVKPRYLVPVHGEFFMRQAHAELGKSLGMKDEQLILIENGSVLETANGRLVRINEKVQTNYVLIDGRGVGDVGAQTIMDRQVMAENGLLITLIPVDRKSRKIAGPIDMITRGFIYLQETDKVVGQLINEAKIAYTKIVTQNPNVKRGEIKNFIRSSLDKFSHKILDRHPLILPIIVEV